MKRTKLQRLTIIALIGAMYTAATLALGSFGFGMVQYRVSEALTLLPVLSPIGIWGVTLGCALSNIAGVITGTNILGVLDVFFGTAATFAAAICSYALRNVRFKQLPLAAALPPVVLNALVIGAELTYMMVGSLQWDVFLLQAASVALGQIVSCFFIGIPLVYALEKTGLAKQLFPH